MSKLKYENMGDARTAATKNAKRDGCKWHIIRDSYSQLYPFYIVDEFGKKEYSSDKLVATIQPTDQEEDKKHTLTVNDEELELIKAILKEKFDPAREFYPGDEETKVSLFEKVCKCLSFS